MIENTVLLAAALLAAAWLFRPALRRSTSWIATVTPLASVIGSGFLVLAPLLARAVDGWALAAMTAIVVLAYGIGAVIRFNIRHAEPLLDADDAPRPLLGVERLSDLALASPLLAAFHGTRDETAIISMSAQVAAVPPAMLVVAAVMSQFSAAVADTAGGGGLFNEFSRRHIPLNRSYLLVVLAAIVIVWSADIFEIIVLASRAFAFYYFLQCLVGLIASTRATRLKNGRLWRTYLVLMALVLLLVVLFAIPDA
ncbi:MAG: hypothetical protein BMS9Abin01_1583 [Gammaproteobacteria bacterium]|nr:MAG: hypothetical protein BMS9Abin01_1583 [Gammaproteobacteria bacterium]